MLTGFNQDGGLQTPRRRGVSEEAEQKLRGDYMSSYFVKLRPLDFNPNQSCNFLSNLALCNEAMQVALAVCFKESG